MSVSDDSWKGSVCSLCEKRRDCINQIVAAIHFQLGEEFPNESSREKQFAKRVEPQLRELQQLEVDEQLAAKIVSDVVEPKHPQKPPQFSKTLVCATLMLVSVYWLVGHGVPLCSRYLGNRQFQEKNYENARLYYEVLVTLKPTDIIAGKNLETIKQAIRKSSAADTMD